ncbi:hypothetical protein [Paracoccus mutanolyticus]|nr:hypothetical protein [Paracoccus mutanolyticus]
MIMIMIVAAVVVPMMAVALAGVPAQVGSVIGRVGDMLVRGV